MATALYVALDGVDRSTLAYGATVTLKTINQGHSTFVCVMDNKAQTFNGLYDAHDAVYIKMAGADIIKGYMDEFKHQITHEKDIWHHVFRVFGRDYSQDLSNLFLSKKWSGGTTADDILDDALARVVSEITYASPSSASTIGGYKCHQQYLMDLFKTVLDRANMEAYVDTAKALQAFNIGANSSGLTLTYADLVGPLEKVGQGLGIRNKVYGLGENIATTTADEYTEATTGWTSGGTLSTQGGAAEGAWIVRAWQDGGPTASVYMEHALDYACQNTGEDENLVDTIKSHFWIQCWAYTPPADTAAATDAYIQFREDSSNYFQYNFTEADIWLALTEFNLGLGRDNEGNFTVNGSPDWAGINKIRFYGTTTAKEEIFVDIDGLNFLDVNYVGFSSDATSRTAYRRRMELQQDNQLTSSTMTDDLTDSILEKKKDTLSHVTLTVDGNSCISGGNFKLWPGYKVTLNFPLAGISSAVYRVEQAELKCFPYQDLSGHGHDFTVKLSCVPETKKLDHLDYPALSRSRSIVPHLSREAFKRRSRRTWLP